MRRVLRGEALVPVAGVVAFLLVFGRFGGVADPAPAARWLGLGVLLAPALMAYAHRWSAAWAAVLGAIVWSSLAASPATVAVVWAYALVALVIARRERAGSPEVVPHRPPPAPHGLPHVAVPTEVTGFALLVVSALVAVLINPSAMAGFGLGCALLARALRHQRSLRRLFGTPQPVHAVRVVEQLGYVHVLLAAPDGQTAREFGFPVAEPDVPPDEDEPHTVAGTLYGSPTAGSWCAVEAEGRVHVPVGPVGEVIVVPYDVVQGLPREIEDDEEQLVDPAALRPADHCVDAVTAREHRIAPQRAWAATIAIGLGSALAAGELAVLAGVPLTVMILVSAGAGAAGYEFGWRSQLRPRLRWHVGGVASVGFRGRDRQPWATDSAVVYDDDGTIVLTAGASVLTVPVPAPWPSPQAQRSADQLVAALRDARQQSFAISPVPPPPEIDVPHRPVALLLAWALSVVATTLIVH
ncbi:hypothetical protein HH310_10155 [Actinoplanes sp. TBRC 11911]|uniref:hypothetical protein n=1 Tax=Actinoplanes sp. TBRC 11911 TaxID=2729386 RepID=UPI00145D16BF|nr:hypothetical protein [Actinoplanes sp. TBRC 11911]NMO51552.1 hypothetical protein [Actinoplanes sp. TBRC 11911]